MPRPKKQVEEAPKRRGRPPKKVEEVKTVSLRGKKEAPKAKPATKKVEVKALKKVEVKALVKKAENPEAKKSPAVPVLYDKLALAYQQSITRTEKKYAMTSGDMATQRVPTSCITLDYYLEGGLCAGMYSVSGQSQSAKSTLSLLILGSMINLGVPMIDEHDAEGSVSADRNYAVAAMRQKDRDYVLGKKVSGSYTVFPRITYSRKNVIDTLFDSVKYKLDHMPDKVYNEERDKWYLRVAVKDKATAHFHSALGEPDKKLSDAKHKYYEVDNPYPQYAVFCDSYPSFVPKASDESEEDSNQSAQQAAAYSKHIKRIVGRLSEKYAIFWGVNQLRKKVRTVGRESPWYRPCGEAIYFYANAQLDMRPMSVPDKWQNSQTKYKDKKFKKSFEPSAEDPTVDDRYSYKQLFIAKNKLGNDEIKMIVRVHERDHTGKGRGIDPVWDAYQFLEVIGLAALSNKKGEKVLTFRPNSDVPSYNLAGKVLSWREFKIIVLASVYKASHLKAAKPVFEKHSIKPFDIVKWCYDLINKGTAAKVANEYVRLKDDKSDDVEDLESDD